MNLRFRQQETRTGELVGELVQVLQDKAVITQVDAAASTPSECIHEASARTETSPDGEVFTIGLIS